MEKLKPQELRSIEQFFQLKQESLLKIMKQYLKSKYKQVFYTPEYVVAVGDIPVGLVAHLDTVFKTPPKDIFYDREKNVMWSPDGLGADDRAGVYSIVQILKQGLRPTIIFTTDEEKGALGAEKLVKDHPEAITDLKYLIELDRRGSNDCVFYECNNPKFEEYVETFDFITNFGSFSDISVICPQWQIAGVNLSIGYMNEHSYSEVLYVGHMLATIKKVIRMLNDANNIEIFEYIPIDYYKLYNLNNNDDDFDWDPSYGVSKQLWRSWHTSTATVKSCIKCGITDFEYNLFPTKTANGTTVFCCSDCVSSDPEIDWCTRCGEPFIVKPEDVNNDICFCYDCIEQQNKERAE